MLSKLTVWNDRRLVLALSLLCLAVVILTGCNSNSAAKKTSTPTPTATTRTAAAVPTGYNIYKGTTFTFTYPTGWNKANAAEGTGVQYTGPKNQVFTAASMGKTANTAQTFNTTFCGPTAFGGTASAPKDVKISGVTWVQTQCTDQKGGKSAVVDSTVHNKNLYYIVYGAPLADFQADKTQYFTTMEKSFTFTA
ncbi:MAG TPA: hypothetical protein VKT82_15300 [Ktedonobacterales bacterium]|nr:hypothetical protein [Ktedonobacterales bacterium]